MSSVIRVRSFVGYCDLCSAKTTLCFRDQDTRLHLCNECGDHFVTVEVFLVKNGFVQCVDEMFKGNMKKVNPLILPAGSGLPPTPIAAHPSSRPEGVGVKGKLDEDVSSVTKPTRRLKKTHWCMAFVSRAGHVLSQYYYWLQRADKPW